MPVMNGNVTSWLMAGLAANPNAIYVTKGGNDSTGDGTMLAPYLNVDVGLAACTANRKLIFLGPGTFSNGELIWPTDVTGIKIIGAGTNGETVIASATGDQVISVTPGVQTAAFTLGLSQLVLDHNVSGQDGILLTNAAMTKALTLYLTHFGSVANALTDETLKYVQADATVGINTYWDGQNGNCGGDVYLTAASADNIFKARGVEFIAGMETAATAKATQLTLINCGVLAGGITGGEATQLANALNCYSITGATYAAFATTDFAGSHSEVIG